MTGVGAALFCFSPAFAQEAATTRERERLSPRSASRAIQRDLLSILNPVQKIDSGMLRQLRGVGLTTRSFGTEFKGLCRRDAVTLWYSATRSAAQPEDAPLRPYSVEAQPWFHIINLSKKASSDKRRGEGVWQADCSSADTGDATSWFAAEDARAALQGAMMLEAAVKAVRSGTLKPEPCLNIFDARMSTCEAVILADGEISKIDSVETCPSDAEGVCYVVELASSTKLTITGRALEGFLDPGAINSITVELYIVVT